MKTLFVSYRVTDLDRSLGFYTALGYVELGRVEAGDRSHLVILKFPGEPAASLDWSTAPKVDASTWAPVSTTSRSRWTHWPPPWSA